MRRYAPLACLISKGPGKTNRVEIPDALLRHLYIWHRLSTIQIARLLGTGKRTIRLRMNEAQIPLRSMSAAANLAFAKGRRKPRAGDQAYNWKGGIRRHSDGYIQRMVKGHPYADRFGYVLEHRLVIEGKIGRYLLPNEDVHHKNEIRNDNRLENLELMSRSAHMALHAKERWARRRACQQN